MIHIQPPKLIYTPDDAEYVATYVLDEEGNPTDEIANYVVSEEGFYAISDKLVKRLTQYAGDGIYTQLAGVKTYCYQWPDKAAYELNFPPEPVEELPVVDIVAPEYDLAAGKAGVKALLNGTYNKLFRAAKGDYPEMEVLTWATKLEESLRYVNGEGSDYIEGISSKRGEEPEDFANKVLHNNKSYQAAIMSLEDMRMTYDNKITNAENESDITEIYKELGGLL